MRNTSKAALYGLILIVTVLAVGSFASVGRVGHSSAGSGLMESLKSMAIFYAIAVFVITYIGISKTEYIDDEDIESFPLRAVFGGPRIYLTAGLLLVPLSDVLRFILFGGKFMKYWQRDLNSILLSATGIKIVIAANLVGALAFTAQNGRKGAALKALTCLISFMGGGIGAFAAMKLADEEEQNYFMRKAVKVAFVSSLWLDIALPAVYYSVIK